MDLNKELDSKILLGRYRIVQLLAEGGMGKVYLARVEGAEGFTRPVVVKVMRAEMRRSDEANRLFRREAEILSKMQHPGITNIIDFGIEDGAHIMVLEYVHGYALARWIDYRFSKNRHIPVDICILIVRRILDALHYAHSFEVDDGSEIEIVHRDVAPDNVLLDRKGYVYLLDFGIARVREPERRGSSHSGVFRGKLGYAAPETLEGEPATGKADQYSAAAMLLELLSLETPFYSESVGETVQRMMYEAPPFASALRGDIPQELDAALQRALSKKPHERFDSVGVFSRTLRACQKADDDELTQVLRSMVREDFEELPKELSIEPLSVREEALARIFPALTKEVLDEHPSLTTQRPNEIAAVQQARGIKRLLWAILAVGGAAALGLGAVVGLLQQQGGEQVVVVGSDDRSPASSSPDPTERLAASTAETTGTSTLASTKATERSLSDAIQSQGAEFEECFVSHLEDTEKSREARVHFTLAANESRALVSIEPQVVRATRLGACLAQAAAEIEFPLQEKRLSFSVPVRARVDPIK